MKIISKYKDYYDYLQGVYGVDEKLILDRRSGTTKFPLCIGLNILVICGKILEFVFINDKFYFDEQIEDINEEKALSKWYPYHGKKPIYIINPNINPKHTWNFHSIHYPKLSDDLNNIHPDIKRFSKKCPIFLYNRNYKLISCEYPSLLELGINKQVDSETIWILLSEWLSQRLTEKEPDVPVGDDKTRILSAGFDLKTSFRH